MANAKPKMQSDAAISLAATVRIKRNVKNVLHDSPFRVCRWMEVQYLFISSFSKRRQLTEVLHRTPMN